MKLGKLITGFILSTLLAVGVGVGIGSAKNEVKGAEALTSAGRIYCKMEYGWWTDAGAAIGAYCWNSKNESQKNANYPGVRMTQLDSEENAWYYDIPSNYAYDKIIFTRVNGSGTISDWSAKTADLTIPTDNKNFYTITSSSAVWGDPGVAGAWSVYADVEPSTSTNQFYVYDPNNILGSTNIKVHGFGQTEDIKPMAFPGTQDGISQTTLGGRNVYSVSLSTSYPNFLMTNKTEGDYQTGDLTITGNVGKVLAINSEGATSWLNSSEFTTDVPASDGYYLVNGTHAFTNKRMTDTTGVNQAEYLNYSASSGEVLNIRSCFLDTNPPKNVGSFGGGATPFGHANNVGDFVFTKNARVNIYAKWEDDSLKFYLAASDYYGYYMVGDAAFMSEFGTSGSTYSLESGVKMASYTVDNKKAIYTFTTNSTITTKARAFQSTGEWFVIHTEMSKSAEEHGVTFDGDGSYVIPAGTYSLYVFESGGADHSSLTWGVPLDAYTVEFMNKTGLVCNGAATDPAALAAVWSQLQADWAFMSIADQETLRTATASESGTNVQKVMARYDVIIYNHSTFTDYMSRKGNSNYTYRSAYRLLNDISKKSSSALIVIISVSIAGFAFAGYFFYKKKKEDK